MKHADRIRELGMRRLGLEWRHLFELASVIEGVRKRARVVVAADQLELLRQALLGIGLHAGVPTVANRIVRTCGDDRFCERVPLGRVAPPDATVSIIVATDAREAAEGQRIDDFGDSAENGRMLGYPACCIAGYGRIEKGAEWTSVLAAAGVSGSGQLPATCNCLAGLFERTTLHPDYFPCRIGCDAALRFNEGIIEAGRRAGLEEEADAGLRTMRGPMALLQGAVVRLTPTRTGHRPRQLALRESLDERWRNILLDPKARYRAVAGGIAVEEIDERPLLVAGCIVEFD